MLVAPNGQGAPDQWQSVGKRDTRAIPELNFSDIVEAFL